MGIAAAGAVVAATPLASMMLKDEKVKSDKNMKVLLINGSARRGGNTQIALEEVATQLHKHNLETEIIQIAPRPVRFCIACQQCYEKQLGHCVFDDDQCNEIVSKMSEADALIVGTPTYYGQPNGGLLALMQRAFYSSSSTVQNKPAAGIAVCRRGGATSALQSLNQMFQILNMPLITSQYWNIVYGRDKGEAKFDAEGLQTMRTLADNMAWMLQSISKNGNATPVREKQHQTTNFIR